MLLVPLPFLRLMPLKSALQIHSPSKKFQDEVGKMIPAGVAKGISGNAKVAVTASVKPSNSVLKNATSWISKYNKSHEVSIDNENGIGNRYAIQL